MKESLSEDNKNMTLNIELKLNKMNRLKQELTLLLVALFLIIQTISPPYHHLGHILMVKILNLSVVLEK